MSFLKLIRWPNLLIVILTQYLVYFELLSPVFQRNGIQPQLDAFQFSCFIVITVLITACGYIINDLLDQKMDAINKPERRIIGVSISTQIASWVYVMFAIVGFLFSIYLAFDTDNIEWLFLYPLAVLFLVFYSTHLKKVPLFGNIVVALFCSGVTGVIWIAEMETIQSVTTTLPLLGSKIKTVLIWYMIFAFLATLFREIVKDLQDMEGDLLGNCRTVPISWGVGTAKLLVLGIGGLLLLLLLIQFFALDNIFQRSVLLFSLFVLFIPLCVCFQRIIVASKAKDYWWVSQFIKLILLGGVLLLFFLRL